MIHNEALDPIAGDASALPQAEGADAASAAAPGDARHVLPAPPPGQVPSRDDVLASLGRRFRGASLKLEFELRTAVTRQIFHRDFLYVSRQLHALEASRRVQGIDRQLLRDALAAVSRRAEGARTLLLSCAAEARALIAAHGHGQADVAFARPTRLQATIVSPHARDFLDILGQADDALIQLEKAWLLGLLEPTAKARHASECRRALMTFKEMVRHQRHVVGTHVREVNAARRQALQTEAANEPPDAGRAAAQPAAVPFDDPPSDEWADAPWRPRERRGTAANDERAHARQDGEGGYAGTRSDEVRAGPPAERPAGMNGGPARTADVLDANGATAPSPPNAGPAIPRALACDERPAKSTPGGDAAST